MKKLFLLGAGLLFVVPFLRAQTTAMDFTHKDCNGNAHHLFSTLDSQNVVILQFFHTCPSCAAAADDLKPMYQSIKTKYGNKIRYYAAPGDDSYPCSSVQSWISSNGFSSMIVPFDSGGVQTAYYGGMGMPTVAVAAGSTHKLLYLANQSVSFLTSDTGLIGNAIRNFLDSAFAGIEESGLSASAVVFPDPASEYYTVSLNAPETGILNLDLMDITGRTLAELTREKIQGGPSSRSFQVNLPDGVYFIRGKLNEKIFYRKIIFTH